MVSRSPGPSKRKAPTELDSVGTRQDGCQAGGQNYRILRSYRRLGGRLAGSGYGGLCLLESAESSPPSKAQRAMTESRRGPLLASERTPRKAPASWTLVAAEPALRGGLGAVTNCCHAAKPLSPISLMAILSRFHPGGFGTASRVIESGPPDMTRLRLASPATLRRERNLLGC